MPAKKIRIAFKIHKTVNSGVAVKIVTVTISPMQIPRHTYGTQKTTKEEVA
jgi:hypothetical protein